MTRQPRDSVPATETLTLRLTPDDRSLLDRLVTARAAELADEGIEVTAASYVRGLIRRDAKAKGMLDEAPARPATPPAAKPKPGASPESETAAVLASLTRALAAGASQADIARRTEIDPAHLSKFKAGKRGVSAEVLRRLAAVLKEIDTVRGR